MLYPKVFAIRMVLRASYEFARNFKFMCGVLLKELELWSYMLYKVLFEHVLSAKEKVFNNFENGVYSPFLSFILDALQMFHEGLVACGIV